MIVVDLREKINKTNLIVLIVSLVIVGSSVLTLTKCDIVKDLDIKRDYWVTIEDKFIDSWDKYHEDRIFRAKRLDNGYTFDLSVNREDYNRYIPGDKVKYNIEVGKANSNWYWFIQVLSMVSIIVLGSVSVIYGIKVTYNLIDRHKRR